MGVVLYATGQMRSWPGMACKHWWVIQQRTQSAKIMWNLQYFEKDVFLFGMQHQDYLAKCSSEANTKWTAALIR